MSPEHDQKVRIQVPFFRPSITEATQRVIEDSVRKELPSLMARASAFVGNDSGPAHMAAAFGIPSVVIFGNSDLELWRPWKALAEVVAAPGPIEEVRPDTVIAALDRLKVAA